MSKQTVAATSKMQPRTRGRTPDNRTTIGFGRFMTAVAQRYKGKVAGYEIWNEPNFAHETGSYVATSQYAAILGARYRAVKAVDSGAIVILGALTPTGINDLFETVDAVAFLKPCLPDPTDERIGLSLLRRDGTKRPSFLALRDYASGK